ncbi:Ribosomal RNA-processing protein 7 [Babesia duncani]|uniref:Ribosomal RNA-processing protein 7 n=1 Tax=Babesia duncani TaxID=323732 RepID=A0AAD9UP60_9APIC|nr:Ribosomal RNA-processing protein 7 [Babesia duncani]
MKTNSKKIVCTELVPGLPFYSQFICSIVNKTVNFDDDVDVATKHVVNVQSLDPYLDHQNLKLIFNHFGECKCTNDTSNEYEEDMSHFHEIEYQKENSFISQLKSKWQRNPIFVIRKGSRSSIKDVIQESEDILKTKFKPRNILQKLADEYMMKYDMEKAISKRLERENMVDDDGFTMVIKGPGVRTAEIDEVVKKQRLNPNTNLSNFYKFQLKQQFEELDE